jgi:pimeloyl-ACP methyl ester carboxylesterase
VNTVASSVTTGASTTGTVGPVRTQVRFRVGLAEGDEPGWEVAGVLLRPTSGDSRTVQILLPGFTYDHRYWTVPGRYDYAQCMVTAGYTVLALDRIGTGSSSRPPAHDVTTDVNAFTLHQVIQQIRAGYDGLPPARQVIVVGHSYGSGVAIVEGARYADIDGLIVSGMLHATAPLHEQARSFFHHASEDPILGGADTDWPEFYMTQRPGLRARMLEHSADIDEEISQYNEFIKSTATIGEGDTLPQTYDPGYSRSLQVPVLVVIGEHDALFSSAAVSFAADARAVHEFEKGFYAPQAQLEVHVIPGAGHSLNIHRSAPTWFAIAREWASRHLPATTAPAGTGG